MPDRENIKNSLTKLAMLHVSLSEKGGPSGDGKLFEQILALQDGILKSFGLPASSDNEKLLWFSDLLPDLEAEKIIKQLKEKATNYLLSDAKPDLQILKDAQELNQDPFVVLPELKISTHVYTLFVYDKILLKRKDTIENILEELRIVNRPDILDALGRFAMLGGESSMESAELFEYLNESGLKYLQQFIISNSNLLTDDDY